MAGDFLEDPLSAFPDPSAPLPKSQGTLTPFDFIQERPTLAAPPSGSIVDKKQLVASAHAYTRTLQSQFESAMEQFGQASGTEFKVTAGRVQKLVPTSSGSGQSASDYAGGKSDTVGAPDGYKWVDVGPGSELQDLYNRWQKQKDTEDQISEDIKNGVYELTGGGGAAGGGGGTIDAAKAYRDSEALKTKEITRQYNDFADRADELYSLFKKEQDYALAAQDQNIQNEQAIRNGTIDYGWATPHAGRMPGVAPLSSILAPSLPDYVRPDYRLNQSVGLPGPQGFDDPQYGADGMPGYAMGTAIRTPRVTPAMVALAKPWPWKREGE